MDGCGRITLEDIKEALKIPDDQFDEGYWVTVMKESVKEWDGSISFEDFKAIMA